MITLGTAKAALEEFQDNIRAAASLDFQ